MLGWGRATVRNAPHLFGFILAAMFFNCLMLMLSLQNLPAANRSKGETSSLETNENEECANTNIVLRSRCALLIYDLLDCTIAEDIIHGDLD